MRTWGEIKGECTRLGFEKASAYSKNADAFTESANRAQLLIASTVRPIYASVTICHPPENVDGTDWTGYDFDELAERFLDFAARPVMRGSLDGESEPCEVFTRFRTIGALLLLQNSDSGRFRVWYRKKPASITAGTTDDTPLELDDAGALLMPLLMAHYVWLDDDERKAVLYWNEYDDLKNQLAPVGARQVVPPVVINSTGWW